MMHVAESEPLAYIKSHQRDALYAPSLATLASVSSHLASLESSSQPSDDSTSVASSESSLSSDSDSCDSYCLQSHRQDKCDRQSAFASPSWKQTQQPPALSAPKGVIPRARRNPRRSAPTISCPPALVRQSERKVHFVDSLVDSATQVVEALWPLSSVNCRPEMGSKGVLPLRMFIQETLRRSRTSYSTLQVALYYLILIKPHIPSRDFTMEQPDDMHASRVLQCGRRMFLAALILASKYLQDRNFSARAWSRISGLNTQEINQNEIAFLLAVNWKLHITDEIFQRWSEIVLRYTSAPQPPPPGALASGLDESISLDWKQVVSRLNPELDNIEGLVSLTPRAKSDVGPRPSVSVVLPQVDSPEAASSIPRSCSVPLILEPPAACSYSSTARHAPALGLLPTPRLTPQTSAYCTPAVGAVSQLLGKSSMGMAMARASSACSAPSLDRWITPSTSPPGQAPASRSYLASSVSTASSPESMISDLSRTSRSSSISSASSLSSAPSKLDIQARRRYAKFQKESHMRPIIVESVAEDCEQGAITSSPESYESITGKDMYGVDDANSGRTWQSYHTSARTSATATVLPPPRGAKRSRASSMDEPVQERVRGLLFKSRSIIGSTGLGSDKRSFLVPARSPAYAGSKRLCCSAEVTQEYSRISSLHPVMGGAGGPGMWSGFLDD